MMISRCTAKIQFFQRMILNIFVSPDDEIRMKESQVLISIMGKLIEQLDSSKVSLPFSLLHSLVVFSLHISCKR